MSNDDPAAFRSALRDAERLMRLYEERAEEPLLFAAWNALARAEASIQAARAASPSLGFKAATRAAETLQDALTGMRSAEIALRDALKAARGPEPGPRNDRTAEAIASFETAAANEAPGIAEATRRAQELLRCGELTAPEAAEFERVRRQVHDALARLALARLAKVKAAAEADPATPTTRPSTAQVIRAVKAEYRRVQLAQLAWLAGAEARRPPSGSQSKVCSRVAKALGIGEVTVWRAWSLGYLDKVPVERNEVGGLIENVKALDAEIAHREKTLGAVKASTKKQRSDDKKAGFDSTRLDISRKRVAVK